MYYVLCGFPSARSNLVRRLCIDIIRQSSGSCDLIYANAPADLRDALAERKAPALLYFDFPDRLITRQLIENDIPVICVRDSFRDVVIYCMVAWNMDLPAAVRHAAHSANCLSPIFASDKATPIDVNPTGGTLVAYANQIALSYGLKLQDTAIDTLAQEYGVADPNSRDMFAALFMRMVEHAPAAAELELPAEDDELLSDISEGYASLVTRDGSPRLLWPSGLLSEGVPPYRRATAIIDLTGPARILFYGPYISLMEGSWVADVRFFVAGNWSGNALRIEVAAAGEVIAASQIILPAEGAFSTRVGFDVTRSDVPLELRGVLNEGAIEGEFQLAGVMLTMLDESPPDLSVVRTFGADGCLI